MTCVDALGPLLGLLSADLASFVKATLATVS